MKPLYIARTLIIILGLCAWSHITSQQEKFTQERIGDFKQAIIKARLVLKNSSTGYLFGPDSSLSNDDLTSFMTELSAAQTEIQPDDISDANMIWMGLNHFYELSQKPNASAETKKELRVFYDQLRPYVEKGLPLGIWGTDAGDRLHVITKYLVKENSKKAYGSVVFTISMTEPPGP